MTPSQIAYLNQFRNSLPLLAPHDRDYVMGHAVALATIGISGDASFERRLLERLILQFSYRQAYCRYTEKLIAAKQQRKIVSYEEWLNEQRHRATASSSSLSRED